GMDFNAYANGHWMDTTAIPADRSSWGLDPELVELNTQRMADLIKGVSQRPDSGNADAAKVAAYFNAYMDEAGIEARSIAPLSAQLAAIDALRSKHDLARALGATLRADVDPMNATNYQTENLFGMWMSQGLEDPSHYLPYLLQGGLGMPERDYYLSDSPKMVTLREQYVAHIATMFDLAGFPNAKARAKAVFELERRLAQAHASREDSEDVQKANNVWQRADFARKARGMDWTAYFDGAQLGKQNAFVVWHQGAIKGEAAQVNATALAVWKDYLRFHLINHSANELPKRFVDAHFAFYEKALKGTPEMQVRWKRAVEATSTALPDAVGQLYSAKYFNAEAKARAQAMVANIVTAFSHRIDKLDWMAPETKVQAQAKLKTLYVGVGYPESWRDYASLKVSATDAVGNAQRAELYEYERAIAKLGKPVDRKEWCMSPQTVNAVNMPLQNALNFPAAILQPPYFDPAAPDAINYGAIGAVIGHEISHSFDDQGAQFDAEGRLRNWWTPADLKHFQASSAALAAQFSAYKPYPDLAVNGQQTLSENIADLAGLTVAFDAYHEAQQGKPAGVSQGYTDDQQFFIAFAQSWRSKRREEAERQQIKTDGHAPAQYRVATVRNLDAWYSLFDVKPGDALYLEPSKRVRVW
ncbi:MAG: M13 family metallopeptidase, partial [Burkholderiales bacterium]|nr:M13 family metallopeptidase [Burkholderiales bacterium]